MSDFNDESSGMQNPIFKIMGSSSTNTNSSLDINPINNQIRMNNSNNSMNFSMMNNNSITEQEIQRHKNKLNNLINKLINSNDVDEEISTDNEIKNEAEFLLSLLNIKKTEINQNNNNKYNNNFFNQNNMNFNMNSNMNNNMNNSMNNIMNNNLNNSMNNMMDNNMNNMMNNNMNNMNNSMNIEQMQLQMMIAQQMLFEQQMMAQQIMQQQQIAQAQQTAMQNILNDTSFTVNFTVSKPNGQGNDIIKVECYPYEKVFFIIDKYRNISGDYDPYKKFIYNATNLSPNLTVNEVGLSNNANILVVSNNLLQG